MWRADLFFFSYLSIAPKKVKVGGKVAIGQFLSFLADLVAKGKDGEKMVEDAFCSQNYVGVAELWSIKFSDGPKLDVSSDSLLRGKGVLEKRMPFNWACICLFP